MESYFAKLQEYLKMDTEISYEEFAGYYEDYLHFLNNNYQQLDKENLIKGRYICTILQANSWERSKRKNSFAKKYKKMAEKTKFWSEAIKYRLEKEGMTASEIEQAEKALLEVD
ncbi:MAG: hypothetical protein ACOYI2_07045 [Bacillota bacterium]|jgi:hypothetical protein|nr:hypothetical protein [Clostridia bacterium]